MNVCSVTSVLCRTTPQWLVWMIARWQQPSMLTTGYFTSRLQVFRLVGRQRPTDFAAADRALEKCRKDDPIVVPHRRNRLVLFEANFVPPDESGPVQIRV